MTGEEALGEILSIKDSDLSDLSVESDFYAPSDPGESLEEMSNENVED